MLNNDDGISGERQEVFRVVGEAAWAWQSNHERFLFKTPRTADHPSRMPWMNANRIWQASMRAERAALAPATWPIG